MRRQIIAGNWKMHGSRAENAALVEAIVHKLPNSAAEVWVCPPFVYLAEMSRALAGSRINLGAQDVCAETQGAFTGEVSAGMLKDVGCAGAIVFHVTVSSVSEKSTVRSVGASGAGPNDTGVNADGAPGLRRSEMPTAA